MTVEHSSMSHTGMMAPETSGWPLQKATPSSSTPMNFWPSCAPCIKLMDAAATIWAYLKTPFACLRSTPAHSIESPLQMSQPSAKPSARLSTRP